MNSSSSTTPLQSDGATIPPVPNLSSSSSTSSTLLEPCPLVTSAISISSCGIRTTASEAPSTTLPSPPHPPQAARTPYRHAPRHRHRRPRPSPPPPPPDTPRGHHDHHHPYSEPKHKHTPSPQLTEWVSQLSNKHLTLHERLERSQWEGEKGQASRRSEAKRWERLVKELGGEGVIIKRVGGKVGTRDVGIGSGICVGKGSRKQVQLERWACQVGDEDMTVVERMEKGKWESGWEDE